VLLFEFITQMALSHSPIAQCQQRAKRPSLDCVCRVFFGHLTGEKLLRKALRGDIALPILRIETSQKAQRGVRLVDLAAYIDKRRAVAVKECGQLTGSSGRG
jgi:hypothetical protein